MLWSSLDRLTVLFVLTMFSTSSIILITSQRTVLHIQQSFIRDGFLFFLSDLQTDTSTGLSPLTTYGIQAFTSS